MSGVVTECNDHHVFPRDTFARTARAEVWCAKPKGHGGGHEAVKGSTAYSWKDTDRVTEEP